MALATSPAAWSAHAVADDEQLHLAVDEVVVLVVLALLANVGLAQQIATWSGSSPVRIPKISLASVPDFFVPTRSLPGRGAGVSRAVFAAMTRENAAGRGLAVFKHAQTEETFGAFAGHDDVVQE